jgi:hypothetical protein
VSATVDGIASAGSRWLRDLHDVIRYRGTEVNCIQQRDLDVLPE